MADHAAGTGPVVRGFVPNLLDRSRLEPIVRAAGATLELADDPVGLALGGRPAAALVLVDLDRLPDLGIFARLGGVPTLGFGSHVERAALQAAREAGCGEVVARSALPRRLAAALAAAGR